MSLHKPGISLGAVGLAALVGSWSATAAAAPDSVAPASGAQHMLAVRVEGQQVLANACRASRKCDPAAGTRFPVPDGVRTDRVDTELVVLDGNHRVMLLSFTPKQGPGKWSLLLAASLRKQAPEVMKLLSGYTRRPKGRPGAQRTAALLREKKGRETVVTVARSYQNASVCGRPAWMNARKIDAATLEWEAAPSRSLHPDDRQGAVPLTARRSGKPFDPQHVRVLSPEVASSALKRNRTTIADRDLSTRWAEARPDDGSGEFIGLSLPKQVPISGLSFAFRPTGDEVKGAAPRSFYLATPDKVFRVSVPEDAWQQPAAGAYEIDFPAPLRTDCLTLVLDTAYGDDKTAPVSVAEVRARTSFDALQGDYGKLVEQLGAAKMAQTEQAKALLMRGGSTAVKAAQAGFDALPRRAREDVITVIDTGGCAATTPFFVERLLGKGGGVDFDPDIDSLASHARDRLRQCRSASTPLLVKAIKERVGKERAWAAGQLALLAPVDAARAIPEHLAEPQPDVRLELRKALALAAKHRRAKPVLEKMLQPSELRGRPLLAQIDLLRALGDSIVDYKSASAALTAVLASDHSFRTRYLLLEPAARLASKADEGAMTVLRDTIARHKSPYMRAHAARLSGPIDKLAGVLEGALKDEHPRVRSAALQGLSGASRALPAGARSHSLVLLKSDPWTFVRADAASAFGAQGPDGKLDAALIEALDDPAWPVRRAVLRALGRRNSQAAAERIHDIADNPKEATDVRAAAIAALGELCRRDSAELLYKLALRAGAAQLPYDQPLGLAALAALGDIKPPDLARRLAPLLAKNPRIPRVIRSITRDTLRRQGRCGAQSEAI